MTPGRSAHNSAGVAALAAVLMLALLAPGTALAVFSRPFIGQLPTSTPTGSMSEPVPYLPLGLTVDSSGNVYVGVFLPEGINVPAAEEFDSSDDFVRQIAGLSGSRSLAFDDMSGKLEGAEGYGSGGPSSTWVAVDNSSDPTAGDVYFAGVSSGPSYNQGGATLHGGSVQRVKDNDEPVHFTCTAEHSEEYISGGELIGKPGTNGGSFERWEEGRVAGVAVDSSSGAATGDIYVIYNGSGDHQVDQFNSKGCFERALTEALVPADEAFGGSGLSSVAVDPTTGDVLVSSTRNQAIYEFTSSGVYLGQVSGVSQSKHFGDDALNVNQMAVSSGGNLYVDVEENSGEANEKRVVDIFGPGAFYPDVVTGGVSEQHEGGVRLNGDVNDENVGMEECKFEYVSEAAFEVTGFSNLASGGEVACVPEAKDMPKEDRNLRVYGQAMGLVPGRIYDYRLIAATNKGVERGGVQAGDVESFAAADRPVVERASVSNVSSSWVDFHAVINPVGADTACHFEYLSAAAFAANGESFVGPDAAASVPVPAVDIGSGDVGVSVDVQAGGLSPATSYRFRVVATNAVGTAVGGARAEGMFSTSPADRAGLPDGRVYELVTPPNKEDAEDLFGGRESDEGETRAKEGLGGATNYDLGYSSEDGSHFLLLSQAAIGSFPASGQDSDVFSRGPAGWSVQPSASPSLGVQSGYDAVSDPQNFSVVGFEDELKVGNGSTQPSLNLVGPPGGPYATIESGDQKSPTPTEADMVGASADLSHIVLETKDHALEMDDSGQDAGSNALYEWTAVGGLRLVNATSKGELLSRCGAVLGQGALTSQSSVDGSTHGAVSADGSKIFFTAPDPEARGFHCWMENGNVGENPPELYMREDGATTVEISGPNRGVKGAGGPQPAVFVGASKNGSKVFFMSSAELTANDTGHSLELYEYDTEAPEGEGLTLVSRGNPETDEGGVQSVPAVSADGSAVYFNAAGKLTTAAPEGGGLYRYDTVTGTTTYIAQSDGYPAQHEPKTAWYDEAMSGEERVRGLGYRQVVGLWVEADYYATGNGEFLIFPSTSDLTGYDSGGLQELYRYDAENQSIVCVSCNPNGSTPSYGATFTRSSVFGDNPAGAPPRAISENGQYVFFDTPESLLPQDTNGKVDVYEWEEDPSSHERTISSISTGQSSSNDFFLDSSPDGRNVFFGTHSELVPADKDEEGDLYDARIEGGFPAPVGAGPCEGDACDNPPPAPSDPTPTLLPSVGEGSLLGAVPPLVVNKKTINCAKPKKLSHGKCVKPKRSKKAKKSAHKSAKRGK